MSNILLTGGVNIDLSIVVPVYKEEDNITPFLERTVHVLESMVVNYEIIFCLDPSPDRTESVILSHINKNKNIKLLVFSRRFGQPAATMAGILQCKGRACVVIDVDLQDQPELIEALYGRLIGDIEVVYARRKSRKGETLLKRIFSHFGYMIINNMSDLKIPRNTGDFRIMSRRVVEELRALNETHGFLRGLVAYVGFKQDFIEYDRDERFAGSAKYNRFFGSLKIGLNGLISFSSIPLQIMSITGFLLAGLSFLLGGWYVIQRITGVDLTPGLPTTVLLITFFSGVQLLALGLMGEYIGRIYDEVKGRPQYIINKKINF
jgi:glycosyltransferase involved in cell wall biosynthesis